MKIEHFGGADVAGDPVALERVLERRFGACANEFWLTQDSPFPAVSILVRDERASVHFFPEDGHPGYVLTRSEEESEPTGSTIFFTNSPSEELEVSNENVVTFSEALQVARDFFRFGELPSNHKWFEL